MLFTTSLFFLPILGMVSASCSVSSSQEKVDADDERSHAIEFIKYLRMRGAESNDFFGDSPITPTMNTYDWQGVEEALQMALTMEKNVTARMKEMIDICSMEANEDHHAGDWLA